MSACSSSGPEVVFTSLSAPDDLEGFARGRLGLLEPTFNRSYLFVAWRHLQGKPFGPDDQSALLRYWKAGGTATSDLESGSRAWNEARKVVTQNAAAPGDIRQYGPAMLSYVNCSDDAFRTAAVHLREKAERLGAGSSAVASWLAAQDQVFQNCGEGRYIPEPLPAGASPAERADRDYQIAAAHFYSEEWIEAETRFRTIAADPASPWQDLAPYLAARCLVRRGTLPKGAADGVDYEALRKAQTSLDAILSDAKLRRTHSAARSLRAFVRYRTEPARRLAELSRELAQDAPPGTLAQELKDYTLLLGRFPSDFKYDVDADEMTAWIAAVQGGWKSPREIAERWREGREGRGRGRGDAWMIAALMSTGATDPWRDEILTAAARVEPASPAYSTAAYHRVRLLVQSGLADDARRLLVELRPDEREDWTGSTRNAFSVFRISLARNLSEIAGALVRVPLPDPEVPDWGPRFPPAAALLIDRHMPLRRILDLAREKALPTAARARLAGTAWLRAVLADRFEDASAAAREAAALTGSGVYDPYLSAQTDADRRFEAALVVLAHPEVSAAVEASDLAGLDGPGWEWRTRDFQAPPPDLELLSWSGFAEIPGLRRAPLPRLFSEAELAELPKEQAVIAAARSGRIWVCQEAVRRATTDPKDPRLPETLYRAIQATRLAYDKNVSPWSRRAFTTLHRLYPSSPWAARAKYWY
jgi:hypothetical protein